ncbi:MAG: hypothetical protein NZM43_03600 [Saprospiraceae bacterium]|nr:hypothetical protein [Saprospiraceae bacterium]MDW8483389.1 hypothetical protein [Saprospiraceae bacterium]
MVSNCTSPSILLAFFSVFFFGCRSAEVVAPPKEVECYVRYLKPEGHWFAEVAIRQRDSTIEVPDGVRYGGVLMQTVPLSNGVVYRSEGKGAYAAEHTFSWNDEKGQPQMITLRMPSATDLSFGSKILSLKKSATLRWQGPPVMSDEVWVILWEKIDRSSTQPLEVVTAAGLDYIEFPAAQLNKLGSGTWTYYVVRKRAFQQEKPGYLFKGVAEYYTDVDTVEFRK